MGKISDLFKKVRDTKGTFHAKMGSIKGRNGMHLTEAEDIKRGGKNTQKNSLILKQNRSVLVAQSYLTLCDLVDCSPTVCSVHGKLQARILEWSVILFSRGSS